MIRVIAVLALVFLAGCVSPPPVKDTLPTTHPVQTGETLWLIAHKYYGKGKEVTGLQSIVHANPSLYREKQGIEAGDILVIPKLESKETGTPVPDVAPQ